VATLLDMAVSESFCRALEMKKYIQIHKKSGRFKIFVDVNMTEGVCSFLVFLHIYCPHITVVT
jgi:hypothetical protein